MDLKKKLKTKNGITKRIVFCVAILITGFIVMTIMTKMKKSPKQAQYHEKALKVEVLSAKPEDVQVIIKGFGEVKPLNILTISPEISGKIVKIHPKLEPGEIIPKGELLFKIDPTNYIAAYKDNQAKVAQWENTIKRLNQEYKIDKERLKTLQRNQALAKSEFKRVKKLYDQSKVGTKSGVDSAEQAFNSATDLADQIAQSVSVFPVMIQENIAYLNSAKASLMTAKANLERCEIRANFNSRIKQGTVEIGQYVTPGQELLTLADDSILEIQIPIDSQEVKNWLIFDKNHNKDSAWFSSLKHVKCKIKWTEDLENYIWEGYLDRIVNFSTDTRTLTAAVRIDATNAIKTSNLPLVAGMFCVVEIPGKTMENVFTLPRWSVSFNNTIYIVQNNKLKTVDVNVVKTDGDKAYVSQGINIGDNVITTRLVDPLENTLIEIIKATKMNKS